MQRSDAREKDMLLKDLEQKVKGVRRANSGIKKQKRTVGNKILDL